MTLFLARRMLATIPLMLIVSMVVFFMVAIIPGDAALVAAGESGTPGNLSSIRKDLGLDRPAPVRYLDWLSDALRGDLGRSYLTRQPVAEKLISRLPVSLEVGFVGMAIGIALGIPLGILAALRRGTIVDLAVTTLGVLGFALPSFVIGLAALYVFVLQLRIGLPVGGWVSPTEDLVGNLKALLLPAATIGITLAASTMRLTRTAVLEVIGEDYVRTARAKGLHPRAVLFRHVLRNALSPVVTILGLQAGILVSGLLVTEQVFSLPGLGRFLVNATQGRDVPEIMGVSMVIVIGIAAINVIVDMAYVWLDPRVQVS